ncbi:DUF4292 domain-containing protein [candidate division KSB3 bacterium]|uniref:DUF4292 domain-containing protein n=1 Tax=candidate division KSB3 bacterium TaxID=2044937 RepID=A0A9D5Q4L3_9BACT|nr:DUF4292 domain-containing protein [candidate division KSB3 bacterium]
MERKSLRRPAALFLLIISLIIVTGCPQKPLPPPLIPGAEFAELSSEEVAQRITRRAEAFHNLRGLGKVRIQTWDKRYKFSEVFVLETPTRFRLETLGFLDQPVIFLTSNDTMLSLYSKKQNVYYRGIASQENLFRLSGINLSVENMILVLSGNPPQLSPRNIEWSLPLPKIQQYYLERISLAQNIIQRIWYSPQQDTISHVQESLLSSGTVTLDVAFEDYRAEAGEYPIPAKILIDRPLDETRVEISYSFYDVNQQLDPELFQFTPPSTAKTYFIDDKTLEEIERLAPYEEFRMQEPEQ